MLFKLSLYSILKRKRRAALVVLAVAITVAAMNIIGGLLAGMRAGFVNSLTEDGPHISLRAVGRSASLDPTAVEPAIEDAAAAARLAASSDGASDVFPELDFGALLLIDDGKNVGLQAIALEADAPYYRSAARATVAGAFDLSPGGIAISGAVAKVLSLRVGDSVTLLVQDRTGSPWYEEFEVRGVFDSGRAGTEDATLFMNLRDARRMVDLDEGATAVAFRLADPFSVDAWLSAPYPTPDADGRSRREAFSAAGYEVRTWKDERGSLLGFISMFDLFNVIMNVLFIFIAATVIANAILMSAFERLREFGALRAIGMKRRQVAGQILLEGCILGTCGSFVGLALSVPLVLHLQSVGLSWGPLTELMGFGSAIHFRFSLIHSAMDLASGVAVAVGGSLWAAAAAARLSIMQSLRSS